MLLGEEEQVCSVFAAIDGFARRNDSILIEYICEMVLCTSLDWSIQELILFLNVRDSSFKWLPERPTLTFKGYEL